MLYIYNTLTHKLEDFIPINNSSVGMYTCGPTVYNYMHIGNLRTFVLSDILKRVLEYDDYKVKAVENITDIDDKIIKKAKEENATISDVSKKYTQAFLKDTALLNIELDKENLTYATDYINKMIDYIKVLIDKGFAYVEKDGSVYFDISKFPEYGRLSRLDKRQLKTGTRILSDEYTKEDVQDFALWKAAEPDEVGFESAFGRGRPGWHIECSVMSQEKLGETFDIHVGGIDLIFPHHENEIAQSEAKTGKKFVNYFVHGAHMLVDGKKMGKSTHNFYTLEDLEKKGIEPLALRYLYLQTHYRQEMNFTFEALEGAQRALNHLREEITFFDEPKVGCAEFEQKFSDAVNDDLNMPKALSVVWELIKSDNPGSAKTESLFKFDKVLGLNLEKISKLSKVSNIPEKVQKLVKEREELRKQKEFVLADKVRGEINKLGFEIQDKENGETQIKKV
ncbi:cysteine--tRNA ligase [Candidatus Microgenomates bacterium]|nr:MAG: cysteine--tRNA ligase [Candidatus Microgenomates bacterium]